MILRYALVLFAFHALLLRAQVANDNCAAAIAITCGQAINGSTELAAADAAPTCGPTLSAPGVWYTIAGTGQQITLSTCPDEQYDTKLNVYRGSCGALVCVGGNDDANGDVFCSTFSFASETGVDYFVLVQGYNGAVGPFTLTATCAALTPDVCGGATPIACGDLMDGSTVGATADAAPFCGTGITAPGVWYDLVGNGQQVIISTCPDEQFDTKLNVFSGPCNALVCVTGNDDDPDVGTYCSTVNFLAAQGVTYHVLVQGYDGETGPFLLDVSCLNCGTPLSPSVTPSDVSALVNWTSTNSGSGFTIEYGLQGFTPGTGSTVTGLVGVDGPPATISGLVPNMNYELYITEQCAGDDSPTAGPVAFTTLADPPAVNATCGGALPIACGGDVNGNTAEGLVANGPTCGGANITARGLWYTFTGNGDDATLSTCSGSGYDTKISVFTGACDALVCAAGSDDGPNCPGNTSSLTMQTQPGATYLVLVHGYNNAEGEFTLSLTCTPACDAQSNDTCAGASILALQPIGGCEASTGTTECAFAPGTPNPPCDPYGNIVDVWYSFNTGTATSASVIIEAVTAPVINAALYSNCGAPAYIECWNEVGAPIALSGLQAGTDYLIRVWNGGGSDAGTFSICVEGNIDLGIASATRAPVRIWPVPASDAIRFTATHPFSTLHVLDLQGRVALTGTKRDALNGALSIAALEAGSYLLLLDGQLAGRFVKE